MQPQRPGFYRALSAACAFSTMSFLLAWPATCPDQGSLRSLRSPLGATTEPAGHLERLETL